MKHLLQIIRLLCTFGCLLMAQSLFAQETLDLLKKLDKGLPASGLNGSVLGQVVAYIGDVNNDGFDDWAVGLPNAANYETGANVGKVYIYFGGNSIQSNNLPDIILEGDGDTYNFGGHISPAGDVNKDGFSDILIDNSQQVQLYFGGNPLDSTPDVTFTKEGFKDNASTAGDVNHDGFDDILIPSTEGVCIFFGGLTMDTQPDVILKGRQERDWFGFSVSKVGDMNKDGFDDIIVGASGFYLNGYEAGRAYVYYGGAQMDTIADLVMTGEHADDSFGSTVSGAGDVNNDGYADVLVSAYRYKNTDKDNGRVYIYYGGTTLDTIADVLVNGQNGQAAGDINKDGFSDLLINKSVYWGGNLMDNIPDFNFPNNPYLAGGGDYNYDGYADIITGQPNDNTMGEGTGCVSIFYGGSQLPSIADVVFYGEPNGDHFGNNVSGVGDLNNDGYNDFIIGAPGYKSPTILSGCINVFFGGNIIKNEPDVILPGKWASFADDVNGDGVSDMIIKNSADSQTSLYLGKTGITNLPDYTFIAASPKEKCRTIASAGDYNNDGYDDIIIGDDLNSTKGIQTGKAHLYFGGSTIDTNPDLTFDGEAIFNRFGGSVASAGDINNDGFSDIMIGAPGYDRTDLLGKLYIYFGSSSPDTIPDVVITGNKHYRRLGSIIASAGDVNNDGYDDIIVSLPHTGTSGFGISYVSIYYGGTVMDTIPDVKIEKMAFGFGLGVSTAGDLNNDGYDDVIIGGVAQLLVYYGGLPMDTIADIVIKGEGDWWDDFGSRVSFAGDINKDGHTDLLIGNPGSNAVGFRMGRAYIYSSNVINTGLEILNANSKNQVYPNPFTNETTIQYNLLKPGKVVVKIFNTSGLEIETLVNSSQTAGDHTITWHPMGLPNGMYFCKIQSAEVSETKKMMLQK